MNALSPEIANQHTSMNPKSDGLYQRALSVLPDGTTRDSIFYKPYPVYANRATGSHIWDEDGNERIDYCNSYTALILGHQNPDVKKAVEEQLKNGTAFGQPTRFEVELAEKIVNMVPSVKRVKFTLSGSEAVMNAIRIARAYTGRDRIIMTEGAYHGSSDPVSVRGGATPSQGIPSATSALTTVVKYNNIEDMQKAFHQDKEGIAAVILEPVQGAGGLFVPARDYLKAVLEIAHEHDALVIFDEIITGFRLSRGGGQELFDVKPDLTTLGKIVAGGFPGAAVGGRRDLMDEVYGRKNGKPRLSLSGTHNAYPLAMVAGLATLEQLTPELYDQINQTGASLKVGLSRLFEENRVVGCVKGFKSLLNAYFGLVKVDGFKDTQSADSSLRAAFDVSMLTKGIYLAPLHLFCVSSATSKDDIETTLRAADATLKWIKQES